MKRDYLLVFAVAAAIAMCACSNRRTFAVSSLQGNYAFYANGTTVNSSDMIDIAGTIDLDGKGNVIGGEQTYDNASSSVAETDSINSSGSSITVGSDGRGTLTLSVAATSPSVPPTETFSVVQVNDKHLLITEFDTNATADGSMDLQTSPNSVPMGGNSFALLDNWNALSFGGVITSDGTNITAEEADDDLAGQPNFQFSAPPITGAIAPPSGAYGTIALYDEAYGGNLEFAYYVVGPEAFRLIEIDGPASQGGTNFYMAGSMFGQGAAAGAFSPASLSGSFVFRQSGPDIALLFGAAGEFTTNGSDAFSSGVIDENDIFIAPVLAGNVSGASYIVDSDGYGYAVLPSYGGALINFGMYVVDPALNITDPNSTTGGGGALMTDLDTDSLGVGFAVPQTSAAKFAGNYAFDQEGLYISETGSTPAGGFYGLVGKLNATGSTLSGTADFNDLDNSGLTPGLTLAGTWTADTSNPGRLTTQIAVNGSTPPVDVTLYQANSNLLLHVSTDWTTASGSGSNPYGTGTLATGVIEKQQ